MPETRILLPGHRRLVRELAENLLRKLLIADLKRKGSSEPDAAEEARRMLAHSNSHSLPTWLKQLGLMAEEPCTTFVRVHRLMGCVWSKLEELGISDLFSNDAAFIRDLVAILDAPDGEKIHQDAVAQICRVLREVVANAARPDPAEEVTQEVSTAAEEILRGLDYEVNTTLAKLRYREISPVTALADLLLRAGSLAHQFGVMPPRGATRQLAEALDAALWDVLTPYQNELDRQEV